MEIIPVIDLRGGVVVRAKRGERAAYRPIETLLSATSDAEDVVSGLLSLHPFRTLYVADLDAIERQGSSGEILDQLEHRFPELALWVDNGCNQRDAAEDFLKSHTSVSLVLGSESQENAELIASVRQNPRVVLSLDFHGEQFLGPETILAHAEDWPERVIVMTLARVGSNAGPDFQRFLEVRERAGSRKLYLAGGSRDRSDLHGAESCGAAGILVASALHDGKLSPADLGEIAASRLTGLPANEAAC